MEKPAQEGRTRSLVEPTPKPDARDYLAVGAFLLVFGGGLARIPWSPTETARDALVAPMGALMALTFAVWLLMVVVRNLAVLGDRIPPQYFIRYAHADFDERIERPARVFNNLFQVPVLFHVVCVLSMTLDRVDRAAVELAWAFVGARLAHALVYLGWNHLPSRFATWIAGCIAVFTLWARVVFW